LPHPLPGGNDRTGGRPRGRETPPSKCVRKLGHISLAENTGSAPIGGQSEIPSVISRGGVSAPGGNRDSADGKEGGKKQYGMERDSAWTRRSTKKEREKKCGERGRCRSGVDSEENKTGKQNKTPNRQEARGESEW
jgi:hypothetical protein